MMSVADDERWTVPSGRIVVVVVVESSSPWSVVTVFWCSTEPSGSVIVFLAVVVGPFLISTTDCVSTPLA